MSWMSMLGAAQGVGGDMFKGAGTSGGFEAGMMPSNKGGAIGQGNADALGFSALKQYRDMSNYANPGATMGLLNNAANTPQQQYRQQSQQYQNPYVIGLMGG